MRSFFRVFVLVAGFISTATQAAVPVAKDLATTARVSLPGGQPGEQQQVDRFFLPATDTDGDNLTYTLESGTSRGALRDPANNNPITIYPHVLLGSEVIYIPPADPGADSFTYSASDGSNDSNIAQVSITVFDEYRSYPKQVGGDIDGERFGDDSGRIVRLSQDGQTLAVSAPFNDGGAGNAGHVRVFALTNGNWTQIGTDIDGVGTNEYFGWSLDLSADGQRLAAGGITVDGNGLVRVYQRSGQSWVQMGNDLLGESSGDEAGYSVALSADGNILAMGEPYYDGPAGADAGRARVLRWDGNSWATMGAAIDGAAAGDVMGRRLALSSDGLTLAVGAEGNDDGGGLAGHARVFRFDGNNWVQLGADIDGESGGEQSGWDIALSADGETIAVGAYFNDQVGELGGVVRVYSLIGNTWTKVGGDLFGVEPGDRAGYAVTLSEDGQLLAIGARGNSEAGEIAGQVRVYRRDTGTWTEINAGIDGEAAGDLSGYSVSLSGGGQHLAIGATFNRDNGLRSGHARVFELLINNPSTVSGTQSATIFEDSGPVSRTLSASNSTGLAASPFSISQNPRYGMASIDAQGEWTYQPHPNFVGSDDFLVAVEDQNGGITIDKVTVTVDPVNAAPTALPVSVAVQTSTAQNTSLGTIALTGADPDLDSLTYEVLSAPNNGSLRRDDPGNGNPLITTFPATLTGKRLLYSPNQDFTGTDQLTYRVSDGGASSSSAAVTISVFDTFRSDAQQLGGDIDGDSADDFAGSAVALSDDGLTVAIGAVTDADAGTQAGQIRVFRREGASWQQLGADIDGESAGDQWGVSVAISGDGTVIAGGANLSDSNGADAGSVRTFRWSGAQWQPFGGRITGLGAEEYAGWEIALSSDGTILLVGARQFGAGDRGHARVFQLVNDQWVQLGSGIEGDTIFDYAGTAVALAPDGHVIAVTSPGGDGGGSQAGHVRVYSFAGIDWQQLGGDIDGEAAEDFLGRAVALSNDGHTLAVSSRLDSDAQGGRGRVRVFDYDGTDWQQRGSAIDGEGPEDASGYEVALSGNGQLLAIGAYRNDGNGTRSGHVRVFQFLDNDWQQVGSDLDGESSINWFGYSVDLSSDGLTLAVGAIENNGNGTDSGHVRVFNLADATPTVITGTTSGAGTEDTGIPIGGSLTADDPQGLAAIDPFAIATAPTHGIASIVADGSWTYTPDINFSGNDSFEVTVTDAQGIVARQTVSVSVAANNATPTATDVFESGLAGPTTFTSILLHGADQDFDELTYTVLTSPNHGELYDVDLFGNPTQILSFPATLASPKLRYIADQGFVGADTFTYRLSDGTAVSSDATVHLSIIEEFRSTATSIGEDIEGDFDFFIAGTAVAVSEDGQRVAVGMPAFPSCPTCDLVRVYERDGAGWSPLGLDLEGVDDDERLGLNGTVALSATGDTLAIGVSTERGDFSNGSRGLIRVFSWSGSNWVQRGSDIEDTSVDGISGARVALSSDGNTLAVGGTPSRRGGAVRVYQWLDSDWGQLGGDLQNNGTEVYPRLVALSADGRVVALGDFGVNGDDVVVYMYSNGQWAQLGSGFALSPQASDIALSADGLTIAIGQALTNDAGGLYRGRVRVFELFGDWLQLGSDILGKEAEEYFGRSVAISHDGLTVAAGAYLSDANGVDSGQARAYRLSNGDWTQIGGDTSGDAGDGYGYAVALSADGLTLVSAGYSGDTGFFLNNGYVRVLSLGDPTPAVFSGDTSGVGAVNSGAVTGQLAAIDPQGLRATSPFVVADTPSNGVAIINTAGEWSYTPVSGFSGADEFTISVTDATGQRTLQAIAITVVGDTDGDGITDDSDNCPAVANANQTNTDTDSDGDACDTDDDDDGLPDSQELILGTDPLLADTDGDGWLDPEEVSEGSDPLDPNSQPELSRGLPIWMIYQAIKE